MGGEEEMKREGGKCRGGGRRGGRVKRKPNTMHVVLHVCGMHFGSSVDGCNIKCWVALVGLFWSMHNCTECTHIHTCKHTHTYTRMAHATHMAHTYTHVHTHIHTSRVDKCTWWYCRLLQHVA